MKEVFLCFSSALYDESKERKHKGLLLTEPDMKSARAYVDKAKKNLELCHLYLEKDFDYKVPEEWFYTLYYCALAILSRIGVESRSQRCTAFFLRYLKDKGIIEYENEYIERITVYKEKSAKTDVDEREHARYSTDTRSEDIRNRFEYMDNLCRRAISQCSAIVYSESTYKLPDDILTYKRT